MKPRTYLHASRTAKFSRLRLYSPLHNCSGRGARGDVGPALRRLVALAMALFLLPAWQGELLAQQAPPPQLGQGLEDYSGQLQSDQSGYEGQPYQTVDAYSQQGNGPVQPLNGVHLQQLVAPIALYPDTLVALVLTASTYPAQVTDADRWRQMQGYASPEQIAAGADAQNWDPSVKALTAFLQVLAQMARNLQWTTDLGNAYYNQPQDVLEAVQVMRQRAQAAGNLQSTPQEAVSYDQGNIELAPVNPQLIYVPAYNPWSVYGQPVSPYPGFSLLGALGSFFGSSPVSYGLGIAMTAFSNTPWGWLAWGLSWLAQSVLFNHENYYSHSTSVADWGYPHGGPRAVSGGGAIAGLGSSYGRPGGVYNATPGNGFVHRPPYSYGRPGGGYNATPGNGFVHRPPYSYTASRAGGSSRGYQTARVGYARPPLEARNRLESQLSRQSSYRAQTAAYQRGDFGERSSGFSGKAFAGSSGKTPHSGGFHPFGGGHASENFHGGGHAQKSFSGGKNFSSGHSHSSGGGHSSGHGGGKHHH
ncbi:MAG: DUF3300 domain-containing protein [Acidobacteriota bacterium]|nr:DUF3300 domain-containing protein [Acidobacteriota bacterium]